MTWADRLLRLAVGDPKHEVVEQLGIMHQREVDQAERLAAGAAQAPTAGAERDLRALAAERGEMAAGLAGALKERGGAIADAAGTRAAPNGATQNHWARLVVALEACRNARAQLARTSPHLLELDPSLADPIAALDRSHYVESVALRTLIARADPQALN